MACFADTNDSQGAMAFLIFIYLQIYQGIFQWKHLSNRSRIDRIMVVSLWPRAFGPPCIYDFFCSAVSVDAVVRGRGRTLCRCKCCVLKRYFLSSSICRLPSMAPSPHRSPHRQHGEKLHWFELVENTSMANCHTYDYLVFRHPLTLSFQT